MVAIKSSSKVTPGLPLFSFPSGLKAKVTNFYRRFFFHTSVHSMVTLSTITFFIFLTRNFPEFLNQI